MDTFFYDYIIVGSGCAGIASSQYASRSGLNTIVIDNIGAGGQALNILQLENYPGIFPIVSGFDFINTMKLQAEHFGAKFIQEEIKSIDKVNNNFIVNTKDKIYSSSALLVATGAEHRLLGVEGEKELTGCGVSYCAVCDGPFFRGKNIVVVGGGDSACTEALYLATLSENVTIIHRRDELRAVYAVVERVKANKNITIKYNTIVKKIIGDKKVSAIQIENVKSGEVNDLQTDAVFVLVGMKARTELFEMLPKDEKGYIKTNEKMETSIKGLYCAGDVRAKSLRQIVTAVSDGVIAANEASMYIKNLSALEGKNEAL